MVESTVHWFTSVAALLGVWLNIRRNVACFYVWFVTNTIWAYADFQHGLPAQAALQLFYVAFSVYGIWSWSRTKHPTSQNVLRGGPGRSRS